jgi:hypothetical protein
MEAFFASLARHGRFRPPDRQGEKEQRTDIGNHRRAATVRRGLARKPEKIPQPNR